MLEFLDPRDLAPSLFLKRASALKLTDATARRWLATVLSKGIYDPNIWVNRGIVPRRIVEQQPELPQLYLENTLTSSVDGFTKLLFRCADGYPVETVIIPLHVKGRYSICLSSQVGCVMGCVFCQTGRMKQRRNLQTWEIVAQYLQAREIVRAQKGRVTGAVFMGMGEPFLNYDRVLAAAQLLCFPIDGAISAKSITISTVGLVPEIYRYIAEARPFRISISLGAACDEKRSRLVPIVSKHSVAEVMDAARAYALARKERVMLSYVCISGENVSVADARALGRLIGDTPVRVDLIDVTDPTGRFLPPTPEELKAFRDALSRYVGQPVVRRYSGGKDIQAACGTLTGGTR